MPEFANPFSGLAADRKVTHSELVRAIRYSIAAEYEAIQLYLQLAESTDNRLAREVLRDIAEEEVVHAGEFLKLLKELEPTEAAFYKEGETEVMEMMEKISSGASEGTASERRPVAEHEADRNSDDETPESPSSSGADSESRQSESSPPSVGSLLRK